MAAKSSKRSARPKCKPRGKPFPPGVSGNPDGRPPLTDEQREQRQTALEIMKAAAPDAAALLVEMAKNEKIRADLRVRCAETIIERVHGKAAQPIDGHLGAEIRIVMGDLEELSG